MKTKTELQTLFNNCKTLDEMKKFVADEALTTVVIDAADDESTLGAKIQAAIDAVVDAPVAFDFASMMSSFVATAVNIETPKQRAARIVAELIAKPGNIRIDDIKVVKVIPQQKDGYIQVSLSTNKALPTIGADGKLMPIFAITDSAVSVCASLTLAGYGECVDWCTKHPAALINIFSDATIEIVTQCVRSGDTYENPFSTSGRVLTARSNRINHYICGLELGPKGLAEVAAIAEAQRFA